MSFSYIDIALIVVVAASGLFGWRKGFLGELVSLTSWILGVVCAIIWGEQLGAIIFGGVSLDAAWIPHFVGSTMILVVSLVIGALVQSLFKGSLTVVGLDGVDQGLGLLFGIARGCFILIAIGIIFNLKASVSDVWNNSLVLQFLMRFEPAVQDLWNLFVGWIEPHAALPQVQPD